MAGVISESLLNLHWLIGFRYLGSDPQDLGDFAKLPEHGHSSERAAGLTLSAAEVRRDPRTQSDRHRRRHDHGLRSQIPRVRHSALLAAADASKRILLQRKIGQYLWQSLTLVWGDPLEGPLRDAGFGFRLDTNRKHQRCVPC